MDALLKVLAYLLVGLGLLTINLWFARAAYNAFVGNPPLVIAPFQIIGKDDAGGKIGATLAGMLLARLARITQEMDASTRSLQAAARERRGQAQIQTLDLPDPAPLSVPERLFAPLDLKMTVGGVEVGGLISWLHGKLSRDSLLQISIQYDGDRVIAVSHAAGDVGHSLWIETKGGNDETVAAIAYALTHRQFAERVPEVEALTPAEFRTLLSTIHRAAELDRQVAHGRSAPKAYAEILPNLEALLDRAPRWSALLRLTAEMAENAGESGRALALYRKEMEGQEASDPRRADVAARIERLTQLIAATTPKPGTAAVPGPTTAPVADRVGFPLALLGVTSREMRGTPPLIAVVGGVPPAGTLPADRFAVVADSYGQSGAAAGTADGDDMMTEYTLTVVQTVELVAPRARFVFAPVRSSRGTSASADILRAMELAVRARPNILLVTLGPIEGAVFEQALRNFVNAGVLVVLAAGNQGDRPVPLASSPVFKTLMAVAASAADGSPAKFTQQAPDIFWAPGEHIPVQTRAGEREARAGTTYAAALAAGVAARVLAEHPNLGVPRLIDTLRETSEPVKSGGPKLLNLEKALARLSG